MYFIDELISIRNIIPTFNNFFQANKYNIIIGQNLIFLSMTDKI